MVREGKIEVNNLDRKSLKASIRDLQDAGVNISFEKSDSDGVLVSKLSKALNDLPSPAMMAKLESIDPEKLMQIGQGDCLGLFVDLSQAECQICPDRDTCIKKYLKNLNKDFAPFKEAMVDLKTDQAAQNITEKEAEAMAKQGPKEEKKVKRVKYDAAMYVYVMDVPNTEKKGTDAHALVQDILDKSPSTLGELYKLTKKHFEYPNKDAFMNEIVMQLRKDGVLKFWEELSKDEKTAIKAAAE